MDNSLAEALFLQSSTQLSEICKTKHLLVDQVVDSEAYVIPALQISVSALDHLMHYMQYCNLARVM